MHYKNGREANNGDQVIVKDYQGNVKVGILHSASVNESNKCNGQVAIPIMVPGVTNVVVSIGEIVHIEDGIAALNAEKVVTG